MPEDAPTLNPKYRYLLGHLDAVRVGQATIPAGELLSTPVTIRTGYQYVGLVFSRMPDTTMAILGSVDLVKEDVQRFGPVYTLHGFLAWDAPGSVIDNLPFPFEPSYISMFRQMRCELGAAAMWDIQIDVIGRTVH